MSEATGSPRDAASVLFDLPGYRVIDALERPDGRREVLIEGVWAQEACPSCGVFSARVHQRARHRLADVSIAGRVEVVLVKRRFACAEAACARRTPRARPWQRAASVHRQVVLVLRWLRHRAGVRDLAVDAGIADATAYRYLHEGLTSSPLMLQTCTRSSTGPEDRR